MMILSSFERFVTMLGLAVLLWQGIPTTEDSLFVTCREGSGRSVSGPVVSSSAGYRAYTTVVAQMRRVEEAEVTAAFECVNTSSLFVGSLNDKHFSTVFQKNPTPEEKGNGLRLIDWTPDGRTLAAVLLSWQPNSHGVQKSILIYQGERNKVVEPDIHALFSRVFGRECSIRLDDVLGFTESGQLVIKVGNYRDSYEPDLDEPCLRNQEEVWVVDVRANTAQRMPNEYVPKRYGTRQVR